MHLVKAAVGKRTSGFVRLTSTFKITFPRGNGRGKCALLGSRKKVFVGKQYLKFPIVMKVNVVIHPDSIQVRNF